jgi:succinyl-diaminopimelate desuccinylase
VAGLSPLARRLAETTLALVDIPSESRSEERVAAWIAGAVPPGRLRLVHDADLSLFYVPDRRHGTPLVLLAGHLDTVPAQRNLPGRIAGGFVHGLGASDMKGGVAVMVELARRLAEAPESPALDVGFLFFPREELPAEESALPGFFAACPQALDAELAIVLEPTDGAIQAGCLGNLNAELAFRGESAHSARPWTGVNAIERAVAGLARILPVAPREVELDGLRFVEVTSATRIEEAAGAELVLRGNSPSAPPVADAPLVRRLREAGNLSLEPKQAWTPVAELAAAGVAAVNYGPGATRYAHRADERVEIAALVRVYETLARFLGLG